MRRLFCLHRDCINDTLAGISVRNHALKNFLDVGCGDGSRTLIFGSSGRTLHGVDRMEWLTNEAKEKIIFTPLDFIKKPLPYHNDQFDIVFSFDVIEHLGFPEIMLQEIRRVLKNDGLFIISTPNRQRFLNHILLSLKLRKIPYAPDKNTIGTDPYAWHIREYTFSELEKLLKFIGFSVTKKHKIFYGLTGWYGFSHFLNFPFFHNIIFECKKN